MKAALLLIAFFALAVLLIPMISINMQAEPLAPAELQTHNPTPQQPASGSSASSTPGPLSAEAQQQTFSLELSEESSEAPETSSSNISKNGMSSFRILDQSTGVIHEVSLLDYVRGAVAAEMPASFHPEALKSQAVAAHTYALYNHYFQQESPDPALMGADFSADPSNMKGYITEETAREFYGDQADIYWEKICEAADSVAGIIIEYEDEPIVAAYHAISAGRTEDAANVWEGEAPYLTPVESEGDMLAPGFEVVTNFSVEQVKSTLKAAYPDMELEGDPSSWFGHMEYSGSGYILFADVGGVEISGKSLRSLFDLRSHNMSIEYNGEDFVFTNYGYGHGVGLSQYGADYLARQGYNFEQILQTYYSGIILKQISI